jgi:Ca2+-binding EF-hand superfamily protein
MDQDRDGTVSLDDLKEVYASLGKAPKDTELKAMLEEGQGPVNFTTLLTLFGDRLNGTDEENVILNAWKNFDQEGTGQINQKKYLDKFQVFQIKILSILVYEKFSQVKDVLKIVSI